MSYNNVIILDYKPKIPLLGINLNEMSLRPKKKVVLATQPMMMPTRPKIATSLLNPMIRSPVLNLGTSMNPYSSLVPHLLPKRHSKRVNSKDESVKQRRARSKFKKAARKCRGSRNYRKCMSKKLSK